MKYRLSGIHQIIPMNEAEYKLLDFSGGLNDSNNAFLIKDNELQTALNVFVNQYGGVEAQYGSTAITASHSAAVRVFRFVGTNAITGADYILSTDGLSIKYSPSVTGSTWYDVGYTWAAGTATFTNGSATVTRITGTAEWTTQIGAGDTIRRDADGTFYTVSSVTDNSNLVLTAVYTGTTATTSGRD